MTLLSGWQAKLCQSLGSRQSKIGVSKTNPNERNNITNTDLPHTPVAATTRLERGQKITQEALSRHSNDCPQTRVDHARRRAAGQPGEG
ncbi:MAG TPA: hypothetical protein VGM32_19710 [Rhodopila sp.]|jgi:hypothetical protein